MQVYEAIEKRRSVRKFGPGDIGEEDLKRILNAGIQAPNAFNSEPWEFIVVSDNDIRDQIAQMRSKVPAQKEALDTAAVVVVVAYDTAYGPEALGSTWACIENMLLAATEEGLGAVTLTFHGKKIKGLLNIPENMEIASVIPLGYPDDESVSPQRIPVEKKIHRDHL